MITRKKGSKALTKRISCMYNCKCDGRKCNSNQKWDNSKHQFECGNSNENQICENDNICNSST